MIRMFEIDGKTYELKYNMATIEKIENTTGASLVATIRKTEGLLSIGMLKVYFGMALFNEEGNRMGQKQGMDIAQALIEQQGYMAVNEVVIVAIDRDCPFLFQVD